MSTTTTPKFVYKSFSDLQTGDEIFVSTDRHLRIATVVRTPKRFRVGHDYFYHDGRSVTRHYGFSSARQLLEMTPEHVARYNEQESTKKRLSAAGQRVASEYQAKYDAYVRKTAWKIRNADSLEVAALILQREAWKLGNFTV